MKKVIAILGVLPKICLTICSIFGIGNAIIPKPSEVKINPNWMNEVDWTKLPEAILSIFAEPLYILVLLLIIVAVSFTVIELAFIIAINIFALRVKKRTTYLVLCGFSNMFNVYLAVMRGIYYYGTSYHIHTWAMLLVLMSILLMLVTFMLSKKLVPEDNTDNNSKRSSKTSSSITDVINNINDLTGENKELK